MESLLSASHITKTYKMGEVSVHALNDVDLELYKGEFIVLLGASGSGKSTLLNILGGLDSPTSGDVIYSEKNIKEGKLNLATAPSAALTKFRREHVGFVFQFYNLIPRLTAKENVELITEISATPMDADEALRLVNLYDRRNHFPSQLSGGEQQRVAIARAIAKKPEILLCDEPTGALDVHTGILVLKAIQKVNKELGTTTAVITHNASIAKIADRVIHLKDGKIAAIEVNERKLDPDDIEW